MAGRRHLRLGQARSGQPGELPGLRRGGYPGVAGRHCLQPGSGGTGDARRRVRGQADELARSLQGNEPKKTVIVFTDGEDKDSYYSHQELLEKVEESDVQLYIVAFLDADLSRGGGFFGVFKSAREKIQQKIRDIPQSTGGEAFFPDEISQLNEVFHTIAFELRNQYRLSYVSSNPTRDGTWRRTDVVVKDAKVRGLKVRAKKGYFAKKDPTPSSQN